MGFFDRVAKAISGARDEGEKALQEMEPSKAHAYFEEMRKLMDLQNKQQQAMWDAMSVPLGITQAPPIYKSPHENDWIKKVAATSVPWKCDNCGGDVFEQDGERDCVKFPFCHITARQIAEYMKKKLNPPEQGIPGDEMTQAHAVYSSQLGGMPTRVRQGLSSPSSLGAVKSLLNARYPQAAKALEAHAKKLEDIYGPSKR